MKTKKVLLVSIGFSPNVGGIETHFDDLLSSLVSKGWAVDVLTYKPITTPIKARIFERQGKSIVIYRLPLISGKFYNLVSKPTLEFLYLTPGLFIALPILLIFKGRSIQVIHSHGLVAGFVSVFWGKLFGKRVITTTHSIYNFPKIGWYRYFARLIFKLSDHVLTLSEQSAEEIESLGVDKKQITVFTYWIDLKRFRKINQARIKLNLNYNFITLYVGRLVPEKGIRELISAAGNWLPSIALLIVGTGPLSSEIERAVKKHHNIIFIGRVSQTDLPFYYSAADLLIVPSIHEEGFGRVILESLACETPVIGSNRGAIPEVIDESVGRLISVTPQNIKNTVEYFYKNPSQLKLLSSNSRDFAVKRYSEKNAETIIKTYSK